MHLLLNTRACGLASAVVTVVVYILCILLFVLAPDLAFKLGKSLFHGVELSSQATVNWGSAVWGLVFWFALSYGIGWLFAILYNIYIPKEKSKL